jgi:gamma-glutamyltranspeptidase
VPGEISGYEEAWRNYGSSHLSWSDLFKPAIDMAQNGFKVPKSLENALNDFLDDHKDTDIKTTYPQFW